MDLDADLDLGDRDPNSAPELAQPKGGQPANDGRGAYDDPYLDMSEAQREMLRGVEVRVRARAWVRARVRARLRVRARVRNRCYASCRRA